MQPCSVQSIQIVSKMLIVVLSSRHGSHEGTSHCRVKLPGCCYAVPRDVFMITFALLTRTVGSGGSSSLGFSALDGLLVAVPNPGEHQADCHANISRIRCYRKTSNISCTLVGKKIIDNSGVVEASPVGAALNTSSFSTSHLASMDWAKTTARGYNEHLNVWILCDLN